jgi:hypothetical protein
MSIVHIPYRIYTKRKILNEVIECRQNGKESYALFFKSGHLEFAVIYKPDRMFAHHHLAFHALSAGFYDFTSTGYKSIFAIKEKIASHQEIEDYIIEQLEEAGISFREPEPVQLTLF